MSVQIAIGGICEQDLDLFFLEETVASRPFRSWLLSRIPHWPQEFAELCGAERSVDQFNGESDLELTFRDSTGRLAKVLVENKIGAGFQPTQLQRYRERAETYVRNGSCVRTAVAVFAPRVYGPRIAGEVDATVGYEDVEEWLVTQGSDERCAYKLQLLRAAMTKHRLGYNPDVDGAVTGFWLSYWEEAQRVAPELGMSAPGPKPAGAGFVWFSPVGLPGGLTLCHKLLTGAVDLHFPRWGKRVPFLQAAIGPFLDSTMVLVKASGSAAVRLVVPRLNTGRAFGDQAAKVRLGLDAARTLLGWAQRNQQNLVELAEADI